jgi:hypothetical protein
MFNPQAFRPLIYRLYRLAFGLLRTVAIREPLHG